MRHRALVSRFGSPLYIYQLAEADAALADLRSMLPAPATVCYSLKANPHPAIAARLAHGGCHAEVSSCGELEAALEAGFDPPSEIIYTGPAKTPREISFALSRGVRRFSAESIADLRRIGAGARTAGTVAQCLIRVSCTDGARGGIHMHAGPSARFGVPLDTLVSSVEEFKAISGVEIVGAHFFPVSNAEREEDLLAEFRTSISAAQQLRAAGLPMAVLDLGGGFPAAWGKRGERVVARGQAAELATLLDSSVPGWRNGQPAIAFESGRYLSAHCGVLVSTVTEVKHHNGRTFLLLDSGINHLGGMTALGRMLRTRLEPRLEPPHGARRSDAGPVTLVGPLCTPADLHGVDIELPEAETGDLVVFPAAGAYGLTASLIGFLSRPLPAEVVLDGDRVASATRLRLERHNATLPEPWSPLEEQRDLDKCRSDC
jgi:diaminopimelate decarboxylase